MPQNFIFTVHVFRTNGEADPEETSNWHIRAVDDTAAREEAIRLDDADYRRYLKEENTPKGPVPPVAYCEIERNEKAELLIHNARKPKAKK